MKKTILEIFKEESHRLHISQLEFVRMARKGCQMLYGDSLNGRIKILKEFKLSKTEIRETILLCMVGGALKEAADK